MFGKLILTVLTSLTLFALFYGGYKILLLWLYIYAKWLTCLLHIATQTLEIQSIFTLYGLLTFLPRLLKNFAKTLPHLIYLNALMTLPTNMITGTLYALVALFSKKISGATKVSGIIDQPILFIFMAVISKLSPSIGILILLALIPVATKAVPVGGILNRSAPSKTVTRYLLRQQLKEALSTPLKVRQVIYNAKATIYEYQGMFSLLVTAFFVICVTQDHAVAVPTLLLALYFLSTTTKTIGQSFMQQAHPVEGDLLRICNVNIFGLPVSSGTGTVTKGGIMTAGHNVSTVRSWLADYNLLEPEGIEIASPDGEFRDLPFCYVENDLAWYGTVEELKPMYEGMEVEIYLSKNGNRAVKYSGKVSRRDNLWITPNDIIEVGMSGSPVTDTKGRFCGVVTDRVIMNGGQYLGISTHQSVEQPTYSKACGDFDVILSHPGSGKTRRDIPKLVSETAKFNQKCFVTAPTRVVAREQYAALKDRFPGKVHLAIDGAGPQEKPQDWLVKITCHSTLYKHIESHPGYLKGVAHVIVDEAHFSNPETILLLRRLEVLPLRKTIMTATWHKHLQPDYKNQSNFTISETQHLGDPSKDMLPLIISAAGLGKRQIAFLPSDIGKFGVESLKNELIQNGVKTPIVELSREKYVTNSTLASKSGPIIILTTDISEMGANYDVDVCYISGYKQTPVENPIDRVIDLRPRPLTISSYVQQRGRVGRRRTGDVHVWKPQGEWLKGLYDPEDAMWYLVQAKQLKGYQGSFGDTIIPESMEELQIQQKLIAHMPILNAWDPDNPRTTPYYISEGVHDIRFQNDGYGSYTTTSKRTKMKWYDVTYDNKTYNLFPKKKPLSKFFWRSNVVSVPMFLLLTALYAIWAALSANKPENIQLSKSVGQETIGRFQLEFEEYKIIRLFTFPTTDFVCGLNSILQISPTTDNFIYLYAAALVVQVIIIAYLIWPETTPSFYGYQSSEMWSTYIPFITTSAILGWYLYTTPQDSQNYTVYLLAFQAYVTSTVTLSQHSGKVTSKCSDYLTYLHTILRTGAQVLFAFRGATYSEITSHTLQPSPAIFVPTDFTLTIILASVFIDSKRFITFISNIEDKNTCGRKLVEPSVSIRPSFWIFVSFILDLTFSHCMPNWVRGGRFSLDLTQIPFYIGVSVLSAYVGNTMGQLDSVTFSEKTPPRLLARTASVFCNLHSKHVVLLVASFSQLLSTWMAGDWVRMSIPAIALLIFAAQVNATGKLEQILELVPLTLVSVSELHFFTTLSNIVLLAAGSKFDHSYTAGPGKVRGTVSNLRGLASSWKRKLNKLTSREFKNYRSRGVVEVDKGMAASRGYQKLKTLLQETGLTLAGHDVVDICCGSGGWMQVASEEGATVSGYTYGHTKPGHNLNVTPFNTTYGDYRINWRGEGTFLLFDGGESAADFNKEETNFRNLITPFLKEVGERPFIAKILCPTDDQVLSLLPNDTYWYRSPHSRNSTAEMYVIGNCAMRNNRERILLSVYKNLHIRFTEKEASTVLSSCFDGTFSRECKSKFKPNLRTQKIQEALRSYNLANPIDSNQTYEGWYRCATYKVGVGWGSSSRIVNKAILTAVSHFTSMMNRMGNSLTHQITSTTTEHVWQMFMKKYDRELNPTREGIARIKKAYQHIGRRYNLKLHPLSEEEMGSLLNRQGASAMSDPTLGKNLGELWDNPDFRSMYREYRANLIKTGNTGLEFFFTMGKREKKDMKGKFGTTASRLIAFGPALFRLFELETFGAMDSWTRDKAPWMVSHIPLHEYGHLFYVEGGAYEATDIAGFDSNISKPILECEEEFCLAKAYHENHRKMIQICFQAYKEPHILLRRVQDGEEVMDLLAREGVRMSGSYITYMINTQTNAAMTMEIISEALGISLDKVSTLLEAEVIKLVISGDDKVVAGPLDMITKVASAISLYHQLDMPRKDVMPNKPSQVFLNIEDVSFCSHTYEWVSTIDRSVNRLMPCRPQKEIFGKAILSVGSFGGEEQAGFNRAMRAHAATVGMQLLINYWHMRDVRILGYALRSLATIGDIMLDKSHVRTLPREWIDPGEADDIFYRVYSKSKNPVYVGLPHAPFLPHTRDIALGSTAHEPGRGEYLNKLLSWVSLQSAMVNGRNWLLMSRRFDILKGRNSLF